ncbi:MAG: fumarylacetoacetate hydrolase family protein [Salinivirgaceae bacterium]|nr:fumarylacetoacetate hydrolase family protein [Salinivirgaceae bacterium]
MKIICIGRNYSEHASELNNPVPTEPVFFLKPDTAFLRNNQPFFMPDFSNDVHYEVELVYRISRVGRNISERYAHRYISGIGVGIDFTARDIQNRCKKLGLPWEIAKSFDGSAPVSNTFINVEDFDDLNQISFHLEKNGVLVQKGVSGDMIFSIDKIIAYVSKFITLKIGDLIFTGTPTGVGSIAIGDILTAYINNELLLKTKVC